MPLTRDEYLLVVLAEECSEIAQAASECQSTELTASDRNELIQSTSMIAKIVSKVLRFGLDDGHPSEARDNQAALADEICDLLGIVEMLREHGVLRLTDEQIHMAKERKRSKVKRYMDYSGQRGRLVEREDRHE